MHYFLGISIVSGLVYCILKLFHKKIGYFKSSVSLDALILFVLLKVITSLGLFIFLKGHLGVRDDIHEDNKFLLAMQLLHYTLGDLFILWNEIVAILFFGLGHVCFINLFMYHQIIEAMTHPMLGLGLVVVPSVVYYFLPNKYKHLPQFFQVTHKLILVLYMLLLYMVLMLPTYHWYFPGMALFVISDLFIAFEWPGAWIAEYMLYVGSLISLYIWYSY